jgi:hypothetical protein
MVWLPYSFRPNLLRLPTIRLAIKYTPILCGGGGGGEIQERIKERIPHFLLSYDLAPTPYTVKKGLRFSRPQPECHQPNFPWPGIIKLFPARESLVGNMTNIPAGDGKPANLFLQCIALPVQLAKPYLLHREKKDLKSERNWEPFVRCVRWQEEEALEPNKTTANKVWGSSIFPLRNRDKKEREGIHCRRIRWRGSGQWSQIRRQQIKCGALLNIPSTTLGK